MISISHWGMFESDYWVLDVVLCGPAPVFPGGITWVADMAGWDDYDDFD